LCTSTKKKGRKKGERNFLRVIYIFFPYWGKGKKKDVRILALTPVSWLVTLPRGRDQPLLSLPSKGKGGGGEILPLPLTLRMLAKKKKGKGESALVTITFSPLSSHEREKERGDPGCLFAFSEKGK